MPTIDYPTKNVKYFAINDIYLRGDDDTVNQYCTENGITLVSYKVESKRFSNDGGLGYQYYENSEWKTEFGYARIVTQIIYS